MDKSLKKFNSRLFVVRGQPANALPKLFKEWGTTCLSFEEDPEPFGQVRDNNIIALCKELGITVIQRVSHTLYDLQKIIDKNGGSAPITYHQFLEVISFMGNPDEPVPSLFETVPPTELSTPLTNDHDYEFGVPTLEQLGFDTVDLIPPVWIGGNQLVIICGGIIWSHR